MEHDEMVLTKEELEKVNRLLRLFELHAKLPYKHISGGFAIARIKSFDENEVRFSLKYGVQSDVEDTVHTESHSVSRDLLCSDQTAEQIFSVSD